MYVCSIHTCILPWQAILAHSVGPKTMSSAAQSQKQNGIFPGHDCDSAWLHGKPGRKKEVDVWLLVVSLVLWGGWWSNVVFPRWSCQFQLEVSEPLVIDLGPVQMPQGHHHSWISQVPTYVCTGPSLSCLGGGHHIPISQMGTWRPEPGSPHLPIACATFVGPDSKCFLSQWA